MICMSKICKTIRADKPAFKILCYTKDPRLWSLRALEVIGSSPKKEHPSVCPLVTIWKLKSFLQKDSKKILFLPSKKFQITIFFSLNHDWLLPWGTVQLWTKHRDFFFFRVNSPVLIWPNFLPFDGFRLHIVNKCHKWHSWIFMHSAYYPLLAKHR